ncbi:hypothetical protein [Altericroceibacterium spongiae]|nr:hypothetical protein [Altericroceibacterium spongiae]
MNDLFNVVKAPFSAECLASDARWGNRFVNPAVNHGAVVSLEMKRRTDIARQCSVNVLLSILGF